MMAGSWLRGILNIVLHGGRRRSPVEPGGFGASQPVEDIITDMNWRQLHESMSIIYPAQCRTRKSLGEMIRKLSVT